MNTKESAKKIREMIARELPYQAKGISVRKGKGTASGWIEITATIRHPADCECAQGGYESVSPLCREYRNNFEKLIRRKIKEMENRKEIELYTWFDDMGEERDQLLIDARYEDI